MEVNKNPLRQLGEDIEEDGVHVTAEFYDVARVDKQQVTCLKRIEEAQVDILKLFLDQLHVRGAIDCDEGPEPVGDRFDKRKVEVAGTEFLEGIQHYR